MKLLARSLLATLMIGATSHALAASSVDLTVTGLITPSACTPTLPSGGTVDYGKISVTDLNADPAQPTALEKRIQAINIVCDAPTLVALQGKDNRAGSDWGGNARQYGLGLVNGTEKLGDFFLSWSNLAADGVPVRSIMSLNNGSTWQLSPVLRPDMLASVADGTTLAPTPLTVLSGTLQIETYIAPTSELTLGNELTMDGSVTLTVQYL